MWFREMSEDDFLNIKEYIEKSEEVCLKASTTLKRNVYFMEDSGETELYLKSGLDSLIIGRIALKNTRKGTGSNIIEMLEDYCRKNEIKKIIIEATVTQTMNEFCIKKGFVPMKGCGYVNTDGNFYGNYVKEIR